MDENEQTNQDELSELFLHTALTRLFILTAAPGAVSMLASAFYDILDGIIVGRLLGAQSFAAVNMAMPFVVLLFAAGDLVGVGSSVPIAIALGADDKDKANNIFTCSVLGILFLGAALGAGFWFAGPAIMGAMGASGQLASDGVAFLRGFAAFAPLSSLMFAIDNYLRICGRIRGSLMLNIFSALFGAALELFFVAVCKVGVSGAALGYSLSLSTCAILGLLPFALGRYTLHFVRPHFTFEDTREVVAAGMPAFLDNVAGRVPVVLLNSSLLALGGEDAVAVYGVLVYVGSLVYQLLYGTCDALQPAVGYNLGAGQNKRVIGLEKRIYAACAAVSIVAAAVLFCFPLQVTRLFISNPSENLLAMASHAVRIYGSAYLLFWIPTCTQAFLTAVKRPRPAAIFSLVQVLIAPVAFLILLRPFGLQGLWFNFPLSVLTGCVIAGFMLKKLRQTGIGEQS